MFDDYAKKLEELGKNVPKVFKRVAGRGAKNFIKTAVEITDREKTVDTGAYKNKWNAEVIEIGDDTYAIVCMNPMEYASWLEDGYKIKHDHFVPFDKMEGTPKTKKLIDSFKTKYPEAKGFIAKARRFKGLKIGRRAMVDTEGFVLIELRQEIEIAMLQKKHGISRSEAKKLIN